MRQIKYRPEIDGLRAIAVCSVILYHSNIEILNFELLKGGYLGVDIFFVISGYLITSIILRELKTTNQFSFKNFYLRRIRRIIPALLFVMLFSLPFGWYLLLPNNFVDFINSIFFSLGFSSNYFFHYSGQIYGAENGLFKPFLHTWSLSVEEQFYILFPLFLYVIFKYFNRYLVSFFFVGLIISLGMAEWASSNHPSFNFYSLFTRTWEMLTGSILAFYEKDHVNHRKYNHKISNFLQCLGVVIIIVSVILFNNDTHHPSIFTIFPITGVCLLIIFSNSETIMTKLLSSKLFVSIGLISYSLYLWHFPIFAFARNQYIFENNKFILILITLILSIISYFFVERPARDRNKDSKKIIMIIFFIYIFLLSIGHVTKEIKSKNIILSGDNGILTSQGEIIGDGKKKFILFGDSHALHIMSYLKDISLEKDIAFYNVTHSACISLPNITNLNNPSKQRVLNYKPRKDCIDLYKNLEKILKSNEDELTVVFYNTWFKHLIKNNTHKIDESLWFTENEMHNKKLIDMILEDIMLLKKRNGIKKKWIIVGRNPGSYNYKYGSFIKCYSANKTNVLQPFNKVKNCEIKGKIEKGKDFQNHLIFRDLLDNKKFKNDLVYLDSYKYLCDDSYCYNFDENNNLIYKDHGHFTYEGSKIIANKLLDIINQVNFD